MLARTIVSTAAIASSLVLVGWELVEVGGERAPSVELLSRLYGENPNYRNTTSLTDCMEFHWIPPDGISMSRCWNEDEAQNGTLCYFCTNDNRYPSPDPMGGGLPMQSPASFPCGDDQFKGICEDFDGNGQYRCTQIQAEPSGGCDNNIQIEEWVHQN